MPHSASKLAATHFDSTFKTTSGYAFYYDNESQEAAGTITSALATTPVPAALPLFAGGLGAIGLFGWRRKKKPAILAA